VTRLPRLSGSEGLVSWKDGALGCELGLTDYEGHGDVRVLLDDGGDGVDVGLVLGKTILSDLVFTVGSQRRAVAVGQVVDYESAHDGRRSAGGVLRFDVGEVGVHGRDLGGGVTVSFVSLSVCAV
jgi:hypothetical protein